MDEAEALCDRVVVMRAGRVIDTGTPAELVDRYAATATVQFTLPDLSVALLDELGQLDGVRQVERTGTRVTVQGDRRIIAHVGASLVRRGNGPPRSRRPRP